jgi:hypothetical protein
MVMRDAKDDEPIVVWIDKQDGTYFRATVHHVTVHENRPPSVGIWGQNSSPWGHVPSSKPPYEIQLRCSELVVTDGQHEEPYGGFRQKPKGVSLCPFCGTESFTTIQGKCVNCNGPKA